MLKTLSQNETVKQSQDAFRQWKDVWFKNAKQNGEVIKRKGTDTRDIMMAGRNRLGILVAMGQSLEDQIGELKQLQHRSGVDIICVDKAFGLLVKKGIMPRTVVVSDAQVKFDYWTKQYRAKTKNVDLIVGATANPAWAKAWAGPVYGVVNKDAIGTENQIKPIIGVETLVPASANVGNALVVIAAEIYCYDEMLLVGYDYSWRPGKNYYAFSGDADGVMSDKRFWQVGGYEVGIDGEFYYTSANLSFAARWLTNYYIGKARSVPGGLNIYNCSRRGILDSIPEADLQRRLDLYAYHDLTEQEKERILVSRARVMRVRKPEELREAFKNNVAFHADILCVPKAAVP